MNSVKSSSSSRPEISNRSKMAATSWSQSCATISGLPRSRFVRNELVRPTMPPRSRASRAVFAALATSKLGRGARDRERVRDTPRFLLSLRWSPRPCLLLFLRLGASGPRARDASGKCGLRAGGAFRGRHEGRGGRPVARDGGGAPGDARGAAGGPRGPRSGRQGKRRRLEARLDELPRPRDERRPRARRGVHRHRPAAPDPRGAGVRGRRAASVAPRRASRKCSPSMRAEEVLFLGAW